VDTTDEQLLAAFIEHHDEAAMTALVQRHAAMVWGVCRRVLRNQHDAEDAFQATFLVLVRRAAAIRSPELLANWLYGVARQTALKARAMAAKRARKTQVTPMPELEARQPAPREDLEALLDGELSRLPDIYRAVIVLCDLEGYTRKEAARQLGVAEGTVATRVTRGRAMLAKRLLRRGLGLSSGAAAAWLPNAASTCVPASVVSVTIRSATSVAAGQAVAEGVLSPTVAALVQGGLKAMFSSKPQTMAAVLFVAALVGLGGGILAQHTAGQHIQADKPPAKADKGDADARKKKAKVLQQERKRLAGTWQLVGVEAFGKKASRKEVDDIPRIKIIHYAQNLGMRIPKTAGVKLVVVYDTQGKWKEQTHGGDTLMIFSEGTSQIDPAGEPKTIDHVVTRQVVGKGYTRKGIYEFVNNDTLRVCFAPPGEARPARFATTKDDGGRFFWVFQRVKDEKADRAKEKP
jgi:RNA polymerase sigma factor (sigma-70 family)